MNDMFATFEQFDESVYTETGATINTALLFRHFVYNCLNALVEEVAAWITDRLNNLENTWTAALNGATGARLTRVNQILADVRAIRQDTVSDDSTLLLLATGRLDFEPPSADEYGS